VAGEFREETLRQGVLAGGVGGGNADEAPGGYSTLICDRIVLPFTPPIPKDELAAFALTAARGETRAVLSAMTTMKSAVESPVESAVKSTMIVETVEMVETAGKPKPRPATIVAVGVGRVRIVPAIIVPVWTVLVDVGRLGSGGIGRVARNGNRRAAREGDHQENRRAEHKPTHAIEMVSPGGSRKTDQSITSKRDSLHSAAQA
jgi:hypothetical protein